MSWGPLTIAAARHSRPSGAAVLSSRGGSPYNDLCQNAVVQVLPPDGTITITGDNTGATDTEDFGNPVSWEAFTIDTCATITVDYCGTDPVFGLVYSILIVGCPDFIANVQNSGTAFCVDGNVVVTYESLSPGTYYVPVLLTAGAEGPYTMTITSDVCDTPPLNDICANATPVAVVQDCALGTVTGDNANTVINSAPPCAITQSQFQDVWYQFDSGTNTEVVISIAPGTIGDIGVEVREACAGSSIFCATGDTAYPVAVQPGMNYRVRMFSNNDFGFGGTFGICITVPGACDAGTLTAVGGANPVTACTNGGDPIVFEQADASGTSLALVLTGAGDSIVAVLDGITLDPDGLLPGEYHIWGLAYDGDLSGADPGQPLDGISATGGCLDVGDAPVTVIIEICEGLMGTTVHGRGMALSDTPEGPVLLWLGDPCVRLMDVFDVRGALLSQKKLDLEPGQRCRVLPGGPASPGLYTVRIHGPTDPPLVGRVFVH
jgi:hypothetical protein